MTTIPALSGASVSIRGHRLRQLWLLGAGLLMALYSLATPPFQAPDEVAHFWRSCAIASGQFQPVMLEGRPTVRVPRGARDLVAVTWVDTAGKIGADAVIGVSRIRTASLLRWPPHDVVEVNCPSFYTPVAYLPQALACFLGRHLGITPLFTFYMGRLFNGGAALLLLFFVSSLFPERAAPALAVASLPMALYLFGSYSPDTLTIALGGSAAILAIYGRAERYRRQTLLVAAALSLAKPVYSLVWLIWPKPVPGETSARSLSRFAATGLVVVFGMSIAAVTVTRNHFEMRGDAGTNAAGQLAQLRATPWRFSIIAAADYVHHARQYTNEFVGRLGWLDIGLPQPLTLAAFVLLVLIGVTTRQELSPAGRLAGAFIVLATLGLISLSQYIVWTPVGADHIDGIQGRYFLPIAPLALMLVGGRWRERSGSRWITIAFGIVIAILHAIAFSRIIHRYY